MSAEIEAYQKALTKFLEAFGRVGNLLSLIDKDTQTLKNNWRRVMVTNGPSSLEWPPSVVSTGSALQVDANHWPDATQLATTLSEYHTSLREARRLHEAIPESMRGVVMKPTEPHAKW